MEATLKGKEDYIARLESRLLQQNELLRKGRAETLKASSKSKAKPKAKVKPKVKPKRSPLKSRPSSVENSAGGVSARGLAKRKPVRGSLAGAHTADVKWQEWRVSQALSQVTAPVPLQSKAIASLSSEETTQPVSEIEAEAKEGDDLHERSSSITGDSGQKVPASGSVTGGERAESLSSRTSRSSRAEAERAVLESLVMDEFSVNEIEGFTEKLHKNFLKFYKS